MIMRGVEFDRPVIDVTYNFPLLVKQWKSGHITPEDVANECNISVSTFCRQLREYRGNK